MNEGGADRSVRFAFMRFGSASGSFLITILATFTVVHEGTERAWNVDDGKVKQATLGSCCNGSYIMLYIYI